jgi:hypothetical protein
MAMSSEMNAQTENPVLISRLAHVVERTGLAMSGAICGTFVAAYLAKGNIETLDSTGFIAPMVLLGMIGFYLGIDIPRLRVAHIMRPGAKRTVPQWDTVELLSATGTFLAAVAALVSVCAIVLDETPQGLGEFVIGSWWLLGVIMQIGAGAIGRLRVKDHATG